MEYKMLLQKISFSATIQKKLGIFSGNFAINGFGKSSELFLFGMMNMSQKSFSEQIHVSFQRINELVNGKRCITPETAWLLSKSLNTSPEFWMNLQSSYDLSKINREKLLKDVKRIHEYQAIKY